MKWYVKQLSQIANVSVRTLHHYDKIGLLTQTPRDDNRNPSYSEGDLLRLPWKAYNSSMGLNGFLPNTIIFRTHEPK